MKRTKRAMMRTGGVKLSVGLFLVMAGTGAGLVNVRQALGELAEARRSLLGTIPPTQPGIFEERRTPDGNYVYEATSARPWVQGGRCEIVEDRDVPGLRVARSESPLGLHPDQLTQGGVFWTLPGIEPGAYWIGVVFAGTPPLNRGHPVSVYLNGRIVQPATLRNPVQVAPDRWFSESLSGEAVELTPGDEIAVALTVSPFAVARVVLYPSEPPPAFESPWKMPTNFGGHQWAPYTALGISVDGAFLDQAGRSAENPRYDAINQIASSVQSLKDPDGNVVLRADLANPLPVPVTVDYRCVVRTFHAETVAVDEARLTLQPHERIERVIPFAWKEGEVTHFAELTLLGVDPPDLSASRAEGGLGWPAHEVYSYFPGHRHALPWPDPFNTRVVRRITVSEPYGGSHQAFSLDSNDWEIGYTPSREPPMPIPGDIEMQRVAVPKHRAHPRLDSMTPRPHGAYFRRTFELPSDLSGRSFSLVVDHVYSEGTAYVNGQRVGNVRGEQAPIICDITHAVQPGENEIVLVVRDLIAIMNPAYVTPELTAGNWSYLDAPGLHGWLGLGVGSVIVHSAPVVSSEDVFVKTSFRNGRIAARITAANRGPSDRTVRVTADVLDDGKPTLNLGEMTLTLNPDEPAEFTLETGWDSPRLWQPGDPHLYAMRVTITDAETGDTLDTRLDRFGFSESWIDGPEIMFNGVPLRFPGHGPITRFSPRGNFIFIRGGGRDWWDEIGIVTYRMISGVYNSASQHNVENDRFWETAEANALAAMRRWQNSPHVIAWDISNEWLCFLHYSTTEVMTGARRFKALSDAVRAYDPTRWTLGNAEGDFYGLHDNHSLHYMRPYFGNRLDNMRGVSEYLPDSGYWRELNRHFRPREDVELSPFHKTILRPHEKVIMDNEFLWKVGELMPPALSAVVGEDNVVSSAVDNNAGPIAWLWKTLLDGHRDLGMSLAGIHNSWLAGVVRGASLPRTFIIPENMRHGYAGILQERRFTVINGTLSPSAFALRWSLSLPGGGMIAQGVDRRVMTPGAVQRGTFSFELPKVEQRTTVTLNVTLEADGEFACAEEWDIEVFPRDFGTIGALDRRVLLFDPEPGVESRASGVGDGTAATLTAVGVTFERTTDLSDLPDRSDPSATLLILAEQALNERNVEQTADLAAFVERGGRVLVLGQRVAPEALPVATHLRPTIWASQVFVRAGTHPIMAGLGPFDLHFWQDDRAVGHGAYTKPEAGNFVTLTDSGNWRTGLDWVQMMEVFRGEGSYLLCQLPLIARFHVEPMAREMLLRTLTYAGGADGFRAPTRVLAVATSPGSALAEALESAQVQHAILEDPVVPVPDTVGLLDAAAAREWMPDAVSTWANALREGATVVVVGAGADDLDWLQSLAGSPLSLTVQPYPIWDGRGFRRGWTDETAGLSQLDLYWKQYSGRVQHQIENPDMVIDLFQDGSIRGPAARELIFPGALVRIPVGRGTLLVDQRRWVTPRPSSAKLASRNLSALMTALDVAIAPFVPPKELPEAVDYRTIDLRPFANRAFVDEVAEDGKGGWTDQGPRADLRTFPTGKLTFRGIPFDIGEYPDSCIVLACARRPAADTMPTAVEIPVGYPVEGFFFLHGAAYVGRDVTMAKYRIQYADGSMVEIPIVGGQNIHDWAGPAPLDNEKGTTSVVAWTGRNEVFPNVGVYRMLWVNEKPDVPVTSVTFMTPDDLRGVPALIGLTAAVAEGQFPLSPEDAERAAQRLVEGRADFAAGRLDEARGRLREALDLNPGLIEACQLLADVAEKRGDDSWILEAYRRWAFSGDRSPMPFNRIAEILERRGELSEALAHYRESLAIEWNQPPVIDAVHRLESGPE